MEGKSVRNVNLNGLDKELAYYLASPYSHKDHSVMEERYLAIDNFAAEMFKQGFYKVHEPIASCHHKSKRHQLPSGYTFWQKRDRWLIDKSDAVLVLMIDGWKESVGVTDEIWYAKSLHKPVYGYDIGVGVTVL